MINFYQVKFCKNYKTKLVFYSKNNKEIIDILKEGKNYKNLQTIQFNQKQTFTIKKRFTLDWHTRQNFNVMSGYLSKNRKFLKLASFYSQLDSTNFSKKFTSLMILNLKTKKQTIKDIQQPNLRTHTFKTIDKSDKINKLSNSKDIYNSIDRDIFSHFQSKEIFWFSNIFMSFSNRNYWWMLLPTRTILTRMRCNMYLKNILNISEHSTASKEDFNSTFDSFPEFLIEKPIYWYWMLPFFGCIALVSNNLNLSFIKSTYPFQKNFDFKIYSNFSQHQIKNSISWEIFQFLDYKKILFDSSLKDLNKISLNNDTLLIQIKKAWLARQKEHYICNYQDNLIQKNFTINLNQLSKIKTIHWWKINWEKVISQQSSLHSVNFENSIKNNYLIDNITLNINKTLKLYSFDSLFYSKFFWYWYSLDTRNMTEFLNLNYSNLIYKKGLQNNQNFSFQKILTDRYTGIDTKTKECILSCSISSLNDYFAINEFPLKIQFPWLFDDFQKNKINKKINNQTNKNFNSQEKIDNNLRGIEINVSSQNKNKTKYPKKLIEFQIRTINLKYKKILDCNFLHKRNFIKNKDSCLVYNLKNSIKLKSSFIFCISSKKQSTIKQNQLVKRNLQLIKQKAQIGPVCILNSVKLLNKQRSFSTRNLYNRIGCEIFEFELNPIYSWNSIEFNNLKKNVDQVKRKKLEINKNTYYSGNYLKKKQSISSFNQASFLLNNFMSKFYFESGSNWFTTQYLINYFYPILNLENVDKNNNNQLYSTLYFQKNLQIQKNPIVMSGYYYPHFNYLFQEKNQIIKNLSNTYNFIDNQIRCPLPPNIISNQLKFNNSLKSNQKKYFKKTFHQALNNNSNYYSLTKQNLSIINKKFGKIDAKSQKFEHIVIFNLLKNSKTLFSKSQKSKINIKKLKYRKEHFNKKRIYKYKTIRHTLLNNNQYLPLKVYILRLQNKNFKIKQNKIKQNIINNKEQTSSLLIAYLDSFIKEKINYILREYIFSKKSKISFFSSTVFSDLSVYRHLKVDREPKRIFTFLKYNVIPKNIYVSNKSQFCNYINSTYNSSGFFNTTKPFVFDKFNEFRKNIRINRRSQNKTYNCIYSKYFSNLLLQKYQRKSKNWPNGADVQGFFYKRINKLNFKQIPNKQNIEAINIQNAIKNSNILNFQSDKFKQLKNISKSKPVAELLWEVRTKHKLPEVLLIQQTLFFQKKLVRKSTEENNIVNFYSSTDQGLSQKVQTLLRKMTQRRSFRKHVFLETLFHWTRDSLSLRKMLRKIYFKNNWQTFFKYILKSNHHLVLADYYANWYKKNLSYNQNTYNLYLSDSFSTKFKANSQQFIKTENIRPFFYKLIQTRNNNKLFQSKSNINFVLKDFYKNLSIDFNLFKKNINNKYIQLYRLHLKNKKIIYNKKLQILNIVAFKKLNHVSNNPLVFPEWKIFNNVTLSNVFIETPAKNFIKIRDNINSKSSFIKYDSLDSLSFIFINKVNNNPDDYLSNELNYINQQNLSKIGLPLYNLSTNSLIANTNNKNSFVNIKKKVNNNDIETIPFHLSFPLPLSFSFNNHNRVFNITNVSASKTELQSEHRNYLFNYNLSNILNQYLNYKNVQYKNSNKFFDIKNKLYYSINNIFQRKLLEKNQIKSQLNYYSKQMSIRNRLLYQKLYFTNILWHSNDIVLNNNSTIFTENQIIKNVIKQNWVFQIKPIYSQNFFDRKVNINLNNLLATLSTWQSKFEIKRDLILQLFYIYFDHAGAFVNYIIKTIILNNIINQIENWNLFKNSRFLITKELIKENGFLFNLEKDFLTKPTWSFDLLNHIKTQYPHLYNQIQIINQSNFNNIQTFNTLIKAPELQSKTELTFSPDFKTQLLLIESFRKNSGKNFDFFKSYNMLSNIYTNSIKFQFIDQSIINKLSSQSLMIRNSTLFCQKWIENRQLYPFYKIQFLKKQRKLIQIFNLLKFRNNQIKHKYITTFENNERDFNFNRKDKKNIISFKRRSGFLFTRSFLTRNFNNFSSFSKVTRTSISIYFLNNNLENISVRNFIFVIQILLLHVCLVFCLITLYQSAFHFCLKSFISIFIILIHYFLNIKYRFKRLIKYVYQSTVQSFITTLQEYFLSSDALPRKLFVFFNNLSAVIFSNKFSIWGKIYNNSIPSLTNFLVKKPFLNPNNLERIQLLKSKNLVNLNSYIVRLLKPSKIKKFNNLKSFLYNIERNLVLNRNELSGNLKFDLIPKRNLLKIISQKKENNRMSLLRNSNIIQKANCGILKNDFFLISNQLNIDKGVSLYLPWEKENFNKIDLLKKEIKNKKIIKIKNKDSSIFKLSFKLLKWNLGLLLLIGESEIFTELEPYREMHWYFLKRLPIFLRSNTSSEDPINMYDYQADEKLRKFKEQFKKSTEIFQKRQNIIEKKTERNCKKENVKGIEHTEILNNSERQNFELINKKYFNKKNFLKKQKQINSDNIILMMKSEKPFRGQSIKILNFLYINKITYLLNNFDFLRQKISRGQPFWKSLFSFLAYTLFVSRLAKLNRQFRDSVLIINYVWIPFGPLTAIISSFLWKNWILNFSTLLNNQNILLKKLHISTKKNKTKNLLHSSYNLKKLKVSEIFEAQHIISEKNNLKIVSSYYSPFKVNILSSNKITLFESKQFSYEIQKIWENINTHKKIFSQLSPPLLNRIFLWNFVKFEKKYKRAIIKWSNRERYNGMDLFDFITFSSNNTNPIIYKNSINIINKYQSLYIKNQERSAQNRYINYKTYDPKVRLYRFYTNFSKNFHDMGIIQDAKKVHPLFGSLLCEIYSGLLSSSTKTRTQLSFFSSTKNILLVGNTNSNNFVLLVQAFAAETGLKLFMEDAKRLRRLGRRGINKSTKRLEKLFEIAQAHSPCIVFLEDIDVIGSKRRVIKINEEEEDEDMAIRSFFSRLIYRKQHNYKSLNQSFIHQKLFLSNEETYRNTQKSIIPESPIPSNLIKYQLTRRKAFSNYFSNTSNSLYKSFITKFNALKKKSSINGNFSNNVSSSPTNTVIIWKLLKSKLVTPKKTIKETPWKHIPIDSMRSIPLITYSIRVKVAKLTMLAIYTMNTQLRLVKDLIKLLEKIQYESYKGFIVFATTNKLAILDQSLRRPGRFDETVYLTSLTVNPNYQRFSVIHFLNVLSVDSQEFVNFYQTFNIINSMTFAFDWNLNSVYGNVFIQDNSEKIFYPTRTSLRDLINATADNVYNQNIFIQTENNIYKNIIPFDIWNNIGFQKSSFSIYSKSALLLSLAYSKAGKLISNLFFQKKDHNHKDPYNCMCIGLAGNNSKKLYNQIPFNSENNQLTIWTNSHIFTQLKKINISYNSRNKNIKDFLINYFSGKIGEFCFFSFYQNTQKNRIYFQQIQMDSEKKTKLNNLFNKNSLGLRSLYGLQPNWKNINAMIFSVISMSCLYSKNHLTSKLFYLDDIFKKRQRIFSENYGPSLLFEYFNLNTESFLKRNTIPLEEHLQKQQMQKYLLNLQQKPLRKFLFNSTSIKISKNFSYLNKISNQTIISTKYDKLQKKNSQRLALFRILFNELSSLDLVTLRPTAMNYYYDKKITSKQRFRKHTYKWCNWHIKKTIDSLEEFQYLDFFPYADKQYNPRRQRWMLTNGYSAYWLAQEKILYYQIYEQMIIECFQISYLRLDKHREMLDYLVQLLMTKQLLTEIQWILFFKRFL